MKNKVLKKHVQLTCGLSKGVVKRLPNKYLTCKYTVLPSNLTEWLFKDDSLVLNDGWPDWIG